MEAMNSNAKALAQKLEENGNFELIGADKEQLPLVAFRLAGEHDYDEFDVSWQLSAERGWMLPAYTMPPDAEEVKIMRALVKETLSRAQVDRLADDIHEACETLEKKGGAHPHERKQAKMTPGY
jgi:glutamate decarboxylase